MEISIDVILSCLVLVFKSFVFVNPFLLIFLDFCHVEEWKIHFKLN